MSTEESSKTDRMRSIRDEVFDLKESPLYEFRVENGYRPVIGEGNHDADIVFIGEGPGLNEAVSGRPFCGASGRILDKLLDHVDIPREDIYIANIIKDRPPKNRDPLPEEIAVYGPFLDRQLEIIEPKVIATLGRYAMDYIMRKYDLASEIEQISKVHGKTFSAEATFGNIVIIPLYHPAVAVYNANEFDTLSTDFEKLKPFYTKK